ncbi:hypothetical protein VSX64_14610 [Aurantimonas sp. C2-6-R+9]|uniref:hypothetical protein n=1 Tax=unclassified Aurantimonas TaxID=2638230 RepID=UPI002E18587E|nr:MULTISPECIES: hypothetical protein [unclassified Aurantimonas]MEC5291988.1 hypothetical protein [Aurantimonas sp. C2-3-R2]MEC5382100.1 hypothetical protein [Aurantimonas sp. C2-6-R+9]MEC5413073.1 hypothetical protein [Aurantimonas sp. C2-4-R8]
MTWAAIIRAVALALVLGLFVTDYGFDLWAKPVDVSIYLFLVAVALGIDATWFRDTLKAVLTRSLGVDRDTGGSDK